MKAKLETPVMEAQRGRSLREMLVFGLSYSRWKMTKKLSSLLKKLEKKN